MKITEQQEDKSNHLLHKLCWFLLIINVGWICVHMFFHHQGLLNPWKLGGYAMYTKPTPLYYAVVDVAKGKVDNKLFNKPLYYLNLYATGGCLSGISKRFYKKIPFMNPEMIGKEGFTRMSFYEKKRPMVKGAVTRDIIGQATLTLDEKGVMTVKEDFCGKKKEFSINVK
jgi:hypothetical protein